MLLENLIENIGHTGGPSQARACLLLVEQLGSDLKELKSLEDAGSVHEARATLTRLLACLLYTSPSPRDGLLSRMPSSA